MRITVTKSATGRDRQILVRADNITPGNVWITGLHSVSLTPETAIQLANAIADVLDGRPV